MEEEVEEKVKDEKEEEEEKEEKRRIFKQIYIKYFLSSEGITHDFAGPFTINTDDLAFGSPMKVVRLDNSGYNDAEWDQAVAKADQKYKKMMVNSSIKLRIIKNKGLYFILIFCKSIPNLETNHCGFLIGATCI